MPSGVMSTRDKMFARAGLGGVVLEADDWPEGVVGVPGVVLSAGLAVKRRAKKKGIKCSPPWGTSVAHLEHMLERPGIEYSSGHVPNFIPLPLSPRVHSHLSKRQKSLAKTFQRYLTSSDIYRQSKYILMGFYWIQKDHK